MADHIGYKIALTGDAGDLEIKLNGVITKMEQAKKAQTDASKEAQQAARATRDEYGRLVDAQGRVVEGLSKWQRNLGLWIDDIGRLRTANGGLVEGLSTLQIKSKMWVDSLGRIHTVTGEVVGKTKEFLELDRKALGEEGFVTAREQRAKAVGDLERYNKLSEQRQKLEEKYKKTLESYKELDLTTSGIFNPKTMERLFLPDGLRELNAELTKVGEQYKWAFSDIDRKLGYTVDEFGRTLAHFNEEINENGETIEQFVDGLSEQQKSLKLWYDELGRIHDGANGNALTGQHIMDAAPMALRYLNNMQAKQSEIKEQAKGLSFDYKKLGAAIGDAFQGGEREADELRKSWSDTWASISETFNSMTGNIAEMFGDKAGGWVKLANTITGVTGAFRGLTNFSKAMGDTHERIKELLEQTKNGGTAFKFFRGWKDRVNDVKNAYVELRGVEGEGLNKFQAFMGAALRAPAAFAPWIAAIGGITAGVYSYVKTAKKIEEENLSDHFKELAAKAKEAGKEIKHLGDTLASGSLSKSQTDFEKKLAAINSHLHEMELARLEAQEMEERAFEWGTHSSYDEGFNLGALIQANKKNNAANLATAEYKNAMGEFDELVRERVDKAIKEFTTEAERLEKEKKEYEAIISLADRFKESMGKEQFQNIETLNRYIAKLDEQIAEAKAKEAEQTEERVDIEKERAERLRASGLQAFLDKTDAGAVTLDNWSARMAEWAAHVAQGDATQVDVNDAVEKARRAIVEQEFSTMGVKLPETIEKTASAYERLASMVEQGFISQEQANAAVEQLQQTAFEKTAELLGITIEKTKDLKGTSFQEKLAEIEKGLTNNDYTAEQAEELRAALRKQEADNLASEQGLELGKSTADIIRAQKSAADNLKQWQKKLEKGEITQDAYNEGVAALQKQTLEAMTQAAGVDLQKTQEDVVAKQKTLKEQLDALAGALDDGTIAQEGYTAAIEATRAKFLEDLARDTGVDLGKMPGAGAFGAKNPIEQYKEAVKRWEDYAKEEGANQEAVNQAKEQLAAGLRAQYAEILGAKERQKQANDQYAETMKILRALRETGAITERMFHEAAREAKATRDAEKNEKRKREMEEEKRKLGLDSIAREAERYTNGEKSWRQELKEQRDKLREANRKRIISDKELSKALDDLKAVEKGKAREEAKKLRDEARSRLGIDSIMESLKTPAQKLAEKMEEINKNAGFFSLEELGALRANALKEYAEAAQGVKADEALEEMRNGNAKTTAGTSLAAGSSELYRALISQTAPSGYQATIKDTTRRIQQTQQENNDLTQDGNYLLGQIANLLASGNGMGGVAVFGG